MKKKIIQILVLGIILLFATGCSINNDEVEETTKLIQKTGFKDYVWDMSPEKVISMEYNDMAYASDTINLEQDPSITYDYCDRGYVYKLTFKFQNNRIKEICLLPQNVEPFEFYKLKKKQFDGKYGKVEEESNVFNFAQETVTANYYVNTYQIELCLYESDFVTITYTEYEM